jgi:hypothetical protein
VRPQNLKALEHVLCDLRRPSDRKKKSEISAAEEVSSRYLGFSRSRFARLFVFPRPLTRGFLPNARARDDILSMGHPELLEKIQTSHRMRGSLWREEYVDNEEHLRRNMTTLLEK